MKTRRLILPAVLLVSVVVHADIIRFRNGDSVQGIVVSANSREVRITDLTGNGSSFATADVEAIFAGRAPTLTQKSESPGNGAFCLHLQI